MNRLLLISLFLISCNQNYQMTRERIEALISSTDKGKVIEGFYLIGETKDTSFVMAIFNNPGDPRVTNLRKFKGISVYQAKMTAMKKITGIEPPMEITYRPDTTIINFYFRLAKQRNLIK